MTLSAEVSNTIVFVDATAVYVNPIANHSAEDQETPVQIHLAEITLVPFIISIDWFSCCANNALFSVAELYVIPSADVWN